MTPGTPAGPGMGKQPVLGCPEPGGLFQAGASAGASMEATGASPGRRWGSSEPGAWGLQATSWAAPGKGSQTSWLG